MNENQFVSVKEYEFDKPLIPKKVFIIDICIGDCHNKSFHTFKNKCVYYIQLTKIGNNEITTLKNSDKEVNIYGLNKKLKIARRMVSCLIK